MIDSLKNFLRQMGMEDLHEVFVENDIDISLIPDLTDDDLREMGLSLGQRKRLLRAIALGAQSPEGARAERMSVPERRQLTVLFVDLVGSTKLASALDPEDLRDVISGYHQACLTAMRANGGHVAYHQGDGLMVYFGYPVAHEDDGERAIRASFELNAAIKKLDTPSPVPLQIRIGIATGIVIVGDLVGDGTLNQEMVVGETPNLAARLQGLAEPGEVVVADTTRRLAGAGFEYRFLGAHELKGFSEPQKVFRVIGVSRVESRFEAHAGGRLQPLVGRDEELSTLSRVWREATGGAGRVALLRGQPGIGKSRLLREVIEALDPSEYLMLRFDCARHLANRALHPFTREIVRTIGLVPDESPETSRDRLRSLIAENPELSEDDLTLLADLLGIETETPLQLDALAKARRTFDVLARRIVGMARSRPLLIVFEDAHWADPATREFLDLLTERIADVPCLLLVTCRPEFADELGALERGVLLNLDRLTSQAGIDLVASVAGDVHLPTALSERILAKADGIPLFVQELTRSVLDSIASSHAPGSPLPLEAISIPATLHDSLMARLDRIEGGKQIAQLGAVIGREFTADMLRAIADDDMGIDTGLRELCEAGMVYEGGAGGPEWFVFHHALVQDAAYESMLKRRRSEVHRAIANAILDEHPAFGTPEPEIVARHCAEGGLDEQAALHWLEAGQHALDRASNLAAVNHLRAALDCIDRLPETDERAKLELAIQVSLAPASMAIYGWAAKEVEVCCARARDLAVRLGDHESLFGAMWGLWTNYFLRGEMEPALETARSVEQMASAVGADLLMVPAYHACGFSHYFRGDFEAALSCAKAGLARFDMDTERQIVRMFQFSSSTALHGFAAVSLWMFGREDEAEDELKWALQLPEDLSHAPSMAFSLAFTQYTLMYQRKWAEVEKTANRLEQLSNEEGFLMWGPQARVFKGFCRAAYGDLAGGLRLVRENYDLYAATGTVLTLMQLVPQFAELLIREGSYDEAIARLDAMIGDSEKRVERTYLPELYRMRGEARYAIGENESGLTDLERARDIATAQGAVPLLARARDSLNRYAVGGADIAGLAGRRSEGF